MSLYRRINREKGISYDRRTLSMDRLPVRGEYVTIFLV